MNRALGAVVVGCSLVIVSEGDGGRGFGDEGFPDGEGWRGIRGVFGDYFLAEEVVIQGVRCDDGLGFVERRKVEGFPDVGFHLR